MLQILPSACPLTARNSFSLLLILLVPGHAPLPGFLLHPPLEAGHYGLNVLHQPGLVSRQFLLKISPDFLKPLKSPCFIFRHALYLMKADDGNYLHLVKQKDLISLIKLGQEITVASLRESEFQSHSLSEILDFNLLSSDEVASD